MIKDHEWKMLSRLLDRDENDLRRWNGHSFRREVGLDSLELFEMIIRIEITFGVELPEELIAEVDNLSDVIACIQSIEANY